MSPQVIKQSAVAAAAYRSGSKLADERTGLFHDYTSRKKVVEISKLIFPHGVKPIERSALWNMAEAAEKRKDARVAREYLVTFPTEMNKEQRSAVAEKIAYHLTERYAVAVDISVHRPGFKNDERNYHAHILTTTRQVTADATLGVKTEIELEDKFLKNQNRPIGKHQVIEFRRVCEKIINEEFEMAGLDFRVDCRSHNDRGTDLKPMLNMPKAVYEIEKRWREKNPDKPDEAITGLGKINLERAAYNRKISDMKNQELAAEKELETLENEIKLLNEKITQAKSEAEFWFEIEFGELALAVKIAEAAAQAKADKERLEAVRLVAALPENIDAAQIIDAVAQAKNTWSVWAKAQDDASAATRKNTAESIGLTIEMCEWAMEWGKYLAGLLRARENTKADAIKLWLKGIQEIINEWSGYKADLLDPAIYFLSQEIDDLFKRAEGISLAAKDQGEKFEADAIALEESLPPASLAKPPETGLDETPDDVLAEAAAPESDPIQPGS